MIFKNKQSAFLLKKSLKISLFGGLFGVLLLAPLHAQQNISLDKESLAGISLQKKLSYQLISKDYDYNPKDCNIFLMKSPSQKIVLDKLCKITYRGKDLQGFGLSLNPNVYIGLLDDKVVSISVSSRLDSFTATKEGIDFLVNDFGFKWGLKPQVEKDNGYSFTASVASHSIKKSRKIKIPDNKKITAYLAFKPDLKILEIDFAVEPIIEMAK